MVVPGLDARIAFAFSAGVATFFAPCAYPLLPGYVAYFLGQDGESRPLVSRLRRAVVVATLVSAGILAVYVALFGVVSAVGSQWLRNVSVLGLGVGVLMVALGVAMASGRFDPSRFHVRLPRRRRSGTGYFLFGVGYAVAAAGCTAPLFAALAGVALAGPPGTAVSVFAAYAAGMVLLVVGVTGLAALGRDVLVRRASRYTGAVQRLAGVALALAGVAQVYLFLFRFGGLAVLGLA